MKNIFIAPLLLMAFILNAQSVQFEIHHKYKVEGDGGWDYLVSDDSTGRLYVSHATMVQIINENNDQIVGMIPDTRGVHGIALAPELNKGFISDGKDTAVTIFNMTTTAVLSKVKVTGVNPDAIVYDKLSNRVFTFNGKSHNSTVIDAKTGTVTGTIPLDGKPEFCVSDGKGHLYDNIEDKNEVAVINSKDMKVENRWSIAPGEGASGMAMDKKTRRLFLVCDNKLMVIMDADNGKVVSTLPIGEHPDAAGFDDELNLAFSSNGEGTMTVVKEEKGDKFKVVQNLATQKGARTLAVNPRIHRVYLPAADFEITPPSDDDSKPKAKPKIIPGSFVILTVEISE